LHTKSALLIFFSLNDISMTYKMRIFVNFEWYMTASRSWLLASYHIEEFGVKGLSDLALPENKQWHLLREKAQKHPQVEGLFYLQTCNRIEYLYCLRGEELSGHDMNSLLPALTSRLFTDLGEITEHLLGICLSKDSLVFGENQILGQFRRAYLATKEENLVGDPLDKILPWVMEEAKRIRNKLPFRHFPSSMSALAAKKIQQQFTPDAKILLIGAGETNELVAKYLAKKNYHNLYVLNRTFSKAEKLCQRLAGKAFDWSKTDDIPKVDAIVCATNSTEILVSKDALQKWQPQLVIDLSLPENVDVRACQEQAITFLNVENFRNDLDRVKSESREFLWDLQKEIIHAKNEILNKWKIHTHAGQIKSFKEHQATYIESIINELKAHEASDDLIKNISKQLKHISYQQILEFRKSIQNDEAY